MSKHDPIIERKVRVPASLWHALHIIAAKRNKTRGHVIRHELFNFAVREGVHPAELRGTLDAAEDD